MTRPLVYRPPVRDEIEEAYTWYESRRTGLGEEFLAAFQETVGRIERNPEGYGRVQKETRAALVKRFKYVIYYRVDATAVVILTVMRGDRNPRRWRHRQ